MATRRVGIAKYFVGIGVSLLGLLAGAWLMAAPFALGFQVDGDWIKATKIDVWTGIGVAVVALLGLLLFIGSLRGELKAAGIIGVKPAPVAPVEAPGPAQDQPEVADQASVTGDEFDRAIASLAATLAADLAERRKMTAGQTGIPYVNGGEG
jgi:hypothetical protein